MLEQIIEVLKQIGIEKYHIDETQSESLECFFVRKKLDLKRKKEVTLYEVTVYSEFEEDGKRMLGSSTVRLHPGMHMEEITHTLQSAFHRAGLVHNPYYELAQGGKGGYEPQKGTLAGMHPEEVMRGMTEALFAPDVQADVFLNSAELFVKRQVKHIINSNGVDVSYEALEVWGEYVVQCIAPQDVETYHQFAYREMDTEALCRDVEEALSMTRARANAVRAPKAGEYRVILSGPQMREILSFYLSRANASAVYRKYSAYQPGMAVQGENICGDALTIKLKAQNPYSDEGVAMKDRVLLQDGVLQTLQGNCRYSYYLGMEPTGVYRSIQVPVGQTPLAQMKEKPYLHVVSFSDFQMDSFSGHFGGEIRLGFLYDGKEVIPVTGGSINASIFQVQENMLFSKERYIEKNYEGPFAVCMEGVSVAGE